MGFFDKLKDTFVDVVTFPFDPGGVISGDGFLADQGVTLDLFGNQAEEARDRIAGLNQQATQEAIEAQRAQLGQISELFSPFVAAGQQPLSELVGAVTGQEGFTTPPSVGFTQALDRGVRGTRRAAAARGLLDSSGTEARLADLVNALTGQEAQRQIEARLQPVRVAQEASGIIGGQEAAAAGAGSTVFNNLANQNLQNAANFGQARQSAFQGVSGGLAGLANLLST